MTITYTAEVATCHGLGCFWKLLFRWKGSIYKLLWPNLALYVVLYYILYFVHLFALDEPGKKTFEKVALYCRTYSDLIPLSFVLGFYVNLVVKRWWEMFQFIPSTDTLALFVSNSIHGQDDRCRLMRRTIMRYVNLSYVMILSMVSIRVKKRFPTLDHLVEAGIMLPNEKQIFDDLNARSRYSKYWMPLVWAGSIIARARKEGRIRDDFAVKTLLDELCNFRSKCGALNGYDWVPIPLVYTQVVTLAVYTFFVASLMGRQLLEEHSTLYVPVFAFLQFFFYMGWLKVAESLINPFGEDQDDFETNWLIDRNLQVSYLIVDEMHNDHPELIRDQYWDDILPKELPHTVASQAFRTSPHMGSTAHLEMTAFETEIFTPSSQLHQLDEESEGDSLDDDDLIPSDGGESGLQTKEKTTRRKIKRQISVSEQSDAAGSYPGSTHNRVSRKPSVLSVFQKVFTRENAMGSNMSIASGVGRGSKYGRSNSRYSTSRPHSPVQPNQDDIFKMSDLSLNNAGSSSNVNKVNPKQSGKASGDLAPLNIKNASDKRIKYGKNLSVESQKGSVVSDTDEEDLPLINSTAPSPAVQIATSAHDSPMSRHRQFLPPKSSPKLNQKTTASPQNSPRITRIPPVSFFMGSDGSQTDRAAPSNKRIPLAEVEEVNHEEEVEQTDDSNSSFRPINIPSRTHKDSGRDAVTELEPIDEQSERPDTASPQ